MTQSKNTKRALLASALSIVLCLAMLAGTTFAWFTDSVSTGVNRIVAGNLDVELYYKTGNMAEYQSVKDAGENPFFRDANGDPIKWEPGVMAYTYFKIINEGSLALKYALTSIAEDYNTLTTDGTTHNLSEVIQFAVIEGDAAISGREDAKLSGLTYEGFDTFNAEGNLLPKSETGENADSADTFTVVAYWAPTASDNLWNVNNGAKVSDIETNPDNKLWLDIEVKLVATQDTVEKDSFDEQYDALAAEMMKLTTMEPGLTETVTIDGVEFYMIAKDEATNTAVLMTKYVQEQRAFSEYSPYSVYWEDSSIRAYLNGEWLEAHPTLSAIATERIIESTNGYSTVETTDKVFLPTFLDLNGWFGMGSDVYTFGKCLNTFEDGDLCYAVMVNEDGNETVSNILTRSTVWFMNANIYTDESHSSFSTTYDTPCGIRPIVCIGLS